jgi:hypothetical protein
MTPVRGTLEMAESLLADMKDEMESSAKRYIEQQASVFEMANILNEAALRAERKSADLSDDAGGN